MTRFVAGNRVELLETGAQYFPALTHAIALAERELFLESYIFANDRTGSLVVLALCAAARRGVRVHVLVDGFGGRDFVRAIMPTLVADGVQVLIYRREIRLLALRRHRLRRLHRKLVLIDDRVAFVGGINIVDDYDAGQPAHPRHDYAVRVEGPLVAHVAMSMRRVWLLVAWANLRRRRMRLPPAPPPPRGSDRHAGGVRAAFLIRDNLRHRREIEDAYLDAIAGAREEVVIACAYFLPGHRFRQALIDAAQRGVRVVLLLQGLSDHPLLAYASRALYPHFLAQGVQLWEYDRSELHAKVAVVDGRWATVGSSNIDPFSLLLAREANVVVDDEAFARELRASLSRALATGGTELHPEALRSLSFVRRSARWLAYQLVRTAIGLAGFGGQH